MPTASKINPTLNKPFGVHWNPTNLLPPNEDLLIVFQGLLSFCYVTAAGTLPYCEVGVFNQDRDHRLRIRIEGDGDCNGTVEYDSAQLASLANTTFTLGIFAGSDPVPPAVFFYQNGDRFERLPSHDGNDFRWLIDVESPDLYDAPVRNKKPYYRPKILFRHGTFFTQAITSSTFQFINRADFGERQSLGSIAYSTAAKIKLNSNQQVKFRFTLPGETEQKECIFYPKSSASAPSAKIYITNLCYGSSGGSPIPRNDFYHHFETFSPPVKTPSPLTFHDPYDLQVVHPRVDAHAPGGVPLLPDMKTTDERGTDDAPCHGMGYGQSPGGTA